MRPASRLAVTALTVTALASGAAPAHAHDQLRATNPADGAVLDVAPRQLDLTFSDEIMPIAPAVVVRDGTGNDLTSAEPTVAGDVVSLPWPADVHDDGQYTVVWRVVSSDGHPIQGAFDFTVGTPEAAAAPAVAATTDETSTDETSTVPYLLAGGATAVLLLTTVLLVRRTRNPEETP